MNDLLDMIFDSSFVEIIMKLTFFILTSVLVLFIFIGIPVLVYEAVTEGSKPTFTLVKDDWKCTQGESHIQMIMVGKIFVPETITSCVQYSKVTK